MLNAIKTFIQDEEGLTIVEYAVAGSLITVAVGAAFLLLGQTVTTAIGNLNAAVTGG